MSSHSFGGTWTEQKLNALRDYLVQYQVIFRSNAGARSFRTIYVDAFAGTGNRVGSRDRRSEAEPTLFSYGTEAQEFKRGSARVALELSRKFHHYIFIDRKAGHIKALQALVDKELPEMAQLCEFVRDDANSWIQDWCKSQDWKKNRAVVFLDPYGMSVEWKTIAAIAETQSIDLWILFPYAIGVNRMTPTDELPDTHWAQIISRTLGTSDWIREFYRKQSNQDLFGEVTSSVTKVADMNAILAYFIDRLKTIFPYVVEKPKILYNSNRSPMYALCFAAGNPKGGKTALKIASHLVRTR